MGINLANLNYQQFGKLRFLDFFPKTEDYYLDDFGSSECGIGMACSDGCTFTYFARPLDSSDTAEISLDFANSCQEKGNAFLRYLGLPLSSGMSAQQIRDSLGIPVPTPANPAHLRFVIGSRWPYYVGCSVNPDAGLSGVWICRKDLADLAMD